MAADPASPRHRDDIQGLRAIAVLLVALAHAGVSFVRGGFVGVDVFFVVSGFLITGLLLAEARTKGSISLVEFYVRRARRILPAAALTLVATDAAAVCLLNFVRARDVVVDSLHAAAFASNIRFGARGIDYFARDEPPSPILHYWSLSVEEQFYFVWPLLLSIALFAWAIRPSRRGSVVLRERRLLAVVLVVAGASLAWSIHRTATLPAAAYFSPFTRAWELGLGASVAIAAPALERTSPRARLVMGWAGIVAVGSAAVAFSDQTPFPGSLALVPTLGTALAVVAGMGERAPRLGVGRLLALRPMCVVGDRSYAFYLWHWPVLVVAAGYAGYELPTIVRLGLLAAAFLLSCVSYALVENPIRRRVRSRSATVIVVAAFAATIVGTAAAALGATDREEHRFATPDAASAFVASDRAAVRETSPRAHGALPAVVAAVEAARRGAPIPSGLTPPIGQLRNFPPPYAPPSGCIARDSSATRGKVCRLGDASSPRLIVLVGDSHALMWLPPLLEMAWRDGWAVVPLLRLGCTPFTWIAEVDGRESCRDWYAWAIREAKRLHPRVTLVGGSLDDEPTPTARAAVHGVVAAASALKASGRVAVIGDPEAFGRDPVECLLARDASMLRCTTTWPAASLAAYDEVARRSAKLGVGFLRTRGFVCYERHCPAVVGHTIVWMDTNHLTVAYSIEVAAAFRGEFLRSLAPRRAERTSAGKRRAGTP